MFENAEIDVTCPKCKAKNKTKAKDVKPGKIIKCRCGAEIKLTGDDVGKELKKLEDQIKKMFR